MELPVPLPAQANGLAAPAAAMMEVAGEAVAAVEWAEAEGDPLLAELN